MKGFGCLGEFASGGEVGGDKVCVNGLVEVDGGFEWGLDEEFVRGAYNGREEGEDGIAKGVAMVGAQKCNEDAEVFPILSDQSISSESFVYIWRDDRKTNRVDAEVDEIRRKIDW